MNDKIVWITGASSGIGEATALRFAKEGWKVAVSARRVELLNNCLLYTSPSPRD